MSGERHDCNHTTQPRHGAGYLAGRTAIPVDEGPSRFSSLRPR
jgi:hypothetical protein